MLAQNFMSAEALQVSEEQKVALIKTLGAFERGEVQSNEFNMGIWACGTVRCIGGWAELLAGKRVFGGIRGDQDSIQSKKVQELFYPQCAVMYHEITVEQGAAGIRNYLTTGDPQWKTVMSEGNGG